MHLPVSLPRRLYLLLALFIWTQATYAQAPANDSLCNAQFLTLGTSCNGFSNGDNTSATLETNEPLSGCAFAGQATTVWFSFEAPASGLVNVTTDFPTGNLFNSQMAIYELLSGDCTDLLNLVEVGCDQDGGSIAFGGGMAEMRQVPVTPGDTFYVQIDGIGGFLQGEFCIEVTEVAPIPPPPNDTLCQAILLTANAPCQTLYDFVSATSEVNEPIGNCIFTPGEFTTWFKFVGPPSGAGVVTMNLPGAAGTLSDANMTIYTLPTGGSCSDLNNLVEYACSTWDYPLTGGFGLLPTIATSFTPGDTFYAQINGIADFGNYNPTEGTYCIEFREVSLPPNDDPCDAVALTTDGVITSWSNIGATADPQENNIAPPPGDPFSDGPNGQWGAGFEFVEHSVWFTFTAPPSGNIQVDLTNLVDVAFVNTQVAVYSATDCSNFNTFVLEGANDDNLFTPLSQLNQFCLTPGDTYYIMVDGADLFIGAEGNFLIRLLDIPTNPLEASLLTKDPSCPGLNDGSALVVSPSGGSGNYFFFWSNGATSQSIISDLGPGTYTVDISDDCDTALAETFTLTLPSPLSVDAGPDPLICTKDSIVLGANPLQMGGTPAATERFYMTNLTFNDPDFGVNIHKPGFPEIRSGFNDQIDFSDFYFTLDASANHLYLLNRFSSQLQRLNLGTNVLEDLGFIAPDGNDQFWTGLAYDEPANILYAVAGEGPALQSYLYAVTATAPQSTVNLVSVTEVEAPIWIAVDTFGVMYTVDFFSDSVYIIVQSTGEKVGLGPLGFDANFSSDAAFDPSTNRMYLNATEDFITWGLYEVDPLLGSAELVFPYLGVERSGALAIAPETLPAYLYLWGPPFGLDENDIPNPTATPNFDVSYFVSVADGCGTIASDTVFITVGQNTEPTLTSTPDNGTSNGTASVASQIGGTPPFTYAWSNGEDSSTIVGLDSGVYTVTISDSAGCVVTDSIEVSSNVSLEDLQRAGLETLAVFPNPTEGRLTIRAELAGRSQVSLRLTDLRGKLQRSTWPQLGRSFEQSLDLSGLARGVYLLTVQTDLGTVQQRIVLH